MGYVLYIWHVIIVAAVCYYGGYITNISDKYS